MHRDDLFMEFVRVVEQAAIAAARTMGQGDRKYADQVAVEAMRQEMETLDIEGVIVIGEGERDEEAQRQATLEAERPFDLRVGPLFRCSLLRFSPEDHVLLLSIHHIVSDGWSLGVLIGELAGLYKAFVEGRPSPLSDLPLQYADYAEWQREWLQGEVLERQVSNISAQRAR